MELGEFELIGRIKSCCQVPEGVIGIGDDCAVIPQEAGMDTLVSTDMLVEGTHFLLDDISPYDLGWKSAAVNISDIAAMGGQAVATFLSVALPSTLDLGWIDRFMEGYRDLSDRYGVSLLGGDTTSSPDRLCINVAVLGRCVSGSSKMRSAALPGDLICVTGCLGDSAGGLNVILKGIVRDRDAQELVRRHYRPMPRIAEGLALASCTGVHAMMDISDGIASDLRHILESSGVGARVDVRRIPLSRELLSVCDSEKWDVLSLATGGGEDYELLFTMSPDAAPDVPFTVIGEITAGQGLQWEGTERSDFKGFTHF